MPFITTPAHKAIFDAIEYGTGNIQIQARAGSGKTTTVIKALEKIPETDTVLFLAFNKAIAEELAERCPDHVQVKTLNSLGNGALWLLSKKQGRTAPKIDGGKTGKILRRLMTKEEHKLIGAQVAQMVSLAKGQGMLPQGVQCRGADMMPLRETRRAWLDIVDHWGIDLDLDDKGLEEIPQPRVTACKYAHLALVESLETVGVIDYDDQLWQTIALDAPMKRRDWVIVDEAQDLNPIQHAMLSHAKRRHGRVLAVGDDRQAIYGFRGADSASMERLRERYDMQVLPLNVTHRCATKIVALANQLVPDLEARADAPEGDVMDLDEAKPHTSTDFKAGDMVVCRTNAPLLKVAYGLIKQRRTVRVMGRDIGEGLIKLVEELGGGDIPQLVAQIDAWERQQVQRITKADPENAERRCAPVADKAECLRVLCEMVDRVAEIPDLVRSLFSNNEKAGAVTLCTAHKSKGLEADRVWILNRHLMPSKWATKPHERQQELNLLYVAQTRAKTFLGYTTA